MKEIISISISISIFFLFPEHCEEIEHPLCRTTLPYNLTSFPNTFAVSQQDAIDKLNNISVIDYCMDEEAAAIMCRFAYPDCRDAMHRRPCRIACENATFDCGPVFEGNTGLSWPLNCSDYTNDAMSEDGVMCDWYGTEIYDGHNDTDDYGSGEEDDMFLSKFAWNLSRQIGWRDSLVDLVLNLESFSNLMVPWCVRNEERKKKINKWFYELLNNFISPPGDTSVENLMK